MMRNPSPLLLALAAFFGVTVLSGLGEGAAKVWSGLALCPPLLWLSLSDLRMRQIPDLATGLLAVIGGTLQFVSAQEAWPVTLGLAMAVLLFLWVAGEVYWRRCGREALGLGDVKLLAAGALVVGAERFWLMLLIASVGGIVAALLAGEKRKDGVPFGPFIAYAILVTFMMPGSLP